MARCLGTAIILFASARLVDAAPGRATPPPQCARRIDADLFLTFDDGPDPAITLPLLDVLAKHGAKATFFITGSRARTYPDVVRAVAAAGHELGVHGERHLDFANLSTAEIRADLEAGRDSILAAVPDARLLLMRPPHGRWTDSVVAATAAAGLQGCLWTCSTHDWLFEATNSSVDFIFKRTAPCLARLPPANSPQSRLLREARKHEAGVVVLAHDGLDSKGCCRKTGGVTPAVMDEILDEAARLHLKAGTCSPEQPSPAASDSSGNSPSPPARTPLQRHASGKIHGSSPQKTSAGRGVARAKQSSKVKQRRGPQQK